MKKIGIFIFFTALILSIFYFSKSRDLTNSLFSKNTSKDKISVSLDSKSDDEGKNIPSLSRKDDLSHNNNDNIKTVKKDIGQLNKQQRAPSSLLDFFSDDSYRFNHSSYLLSKRLRSIPSSVYNEDLGAVVFQDSGYTYFEGSEVSVGMPTLYDVNQKRVVLLTGRLILKDHDLALQIARQYNSDVDLTMQHLNVFVVNLGPVVLEVYSSSNSLMEIEMIEGGVHEK